MSLPTFEPGAFEEAGYARGYRYIAGLDEVGVGPLAGPVVAAAVVLPRGLLNLEIKDSKLLAASKRDSLAAWIKEKAVAWAVGIVSAEEIDRINILNATHLAMAIAFRQLNPAPDYLLIDGAYEIPRTLLRGESSRLDAFPCQKAIKKGDRICFSIAAASILAKVTRDQLMQEYDRLYPQYSFGCHKGYASEVHLKALRQFGPSPIHRRSFGSVRKVLGKALGEMAPAPLFRQQ
ncbi:MAG TPA: ribonuclease HII [Candidatus Acidoferrales bacterium]|nr:ribonuclease HII [Candidatus Acidoferrales bacterium]